MSVVQNTFAFQLEHDEERAVHQPISKSAAFKRSDRILYLDFLADMFPTLRKIDETESASANTCYIPGFEVPMHYSNAMKIFHQPVYFDSGVYQHENNYLNMTLTALSRLARSTPSGWCRRITQG